jgi:PEGA domain
MRINSFAGMGALLLVVTAIPLLGQQNSGYLKTNVDPGRAGVFIDGKYVGPAGNFGFGRKYAVAAGEHEVRLSEPRYKDVVTKVTIQPGKTTKVVEDMAWAAGYWFPPDGLWEALPPAKPPFGTLRTICPDKFAAVYVDGRFVGHAGEFNDRVQGLLLNPGTYTVKIVPVSGGQGHEEQIKIETGKVATVRS